MSRNVSSGLFSKAYLCSLAVYFKQASSCFKQAKHLSQWHSSSGMTTDIQREVLDLLLEVDRIGEHLSGRQVPASEVHWASDVPVLESVSLPATSFDYLGVLLMVKLEAPFWTILDLEKPQEMQETRDFWLQSALEGVHCATVETVQRVIERGADANAQCRQAKNASSPAGGDMATSLQLLSLIVEQLVSIKPWSPDLSTIAPQLRSSVWDQEDSDLRNTLNVVKLLLKHGCDPDVLVPDSITGEASALLSRNFGDKFRELMGEVKPFRMRIRDLFDPAKLAIPCVPRAGKEARLMEEWKWFQTEMTAAFNEASQKQQQPAS